MPRLHPLSDVHTEVGSYAPPADLCCDVVVLAGDIGKGIRGLDWGREAFPDCEVVYVAGNHEYYGGALPRLTDKLRDRAVELGVHFLERDTKDVAGVRFVGTTLWTDFQLFGDDGTLWAMENCRQSMNDFRKIRRSPSYSRLAPRDVQLACKTSRSWLTEQADVESPLPTVVVTHHAPSMRSIEERWRTRVVTAAYASNFDDVVAASGASLWIHGHTHHCVDYRIGDTRVVTNTRGYPGELVPGFDPSLIIEV